MDYFEYFVCSVYLVICVFYIIPVQCSAARGKRILVDDKDYVATSLHQMEIEIQNLKATVAEKDIHFIQMQNVVHGLADRLNQKDTEVSKLQNATVEQTNQITHLTQEISALQSKVMVLEGSNSPIAFYAYLRGSLPLKTLQTHQTIVYDQVDLNLGNGYNKANGKFTTPTNGTYVFHVATGAIDQSHASVELVVNGIIKDVSWADSMDHADRSFATSATPVSLKQGDVVLARIGSAHDGNLLESDTLIRCSFSGFRLY